MDYFARLTGGNYSVVVAGILFIFLMSLVNILLPVDTIFAASNVAATKGLTLSPLRNELEIEPGRSLDRTLKLINYSDKPMTVHLSAEKFSVINQQYDYAFSAESDTAKWVTFAEDEVSLEPGKTEVVPYNVGVPLTAEPGGRYISLFATTDTTDSSDGVKLRQRIGSLMYLTVTGKVGRAGHVVSLTSPWAIAGPDSWSVAVQNSGTTHFHSRYSVNIQNLIGNDVITNVSGDALILPGTVRLISDTLPVPRLPGVYKIVYTIGLGDTPASTETRYVLYMPFWATISVLLIGVSLVGFLVAHKRSRKN